MSKVIMRLALTDGEGTVIDLWELDADDPTSDAEAFEALCGAGVIARVTQDKIKAALAVCYEAGDGVAEQEDNR